MELSDRYLEITDDLVWPLFFMARDYPNMISPDTRELVLEKVAEIRAHWHKNASTFKKSMQKKVPLDENLIKDHNIKNNKIILLLDYYNVKNEERKKEIIFAIQKNIDCGQFYKIYIFLEKNEERSSEDLANDFFVQSNVQFIRDCNRSTYRSFLDFIKNKTLQDEKDAVFILTNNDCYFDESVSLFKYVNFNWGKTVFSMTRKDLLSDGSIIDALHPDMWDGAGHIPDTNQLPSVVRKKLVSQTEQILGPDSSDAWAFKINLADCTVDLDFELGRYHCENQFLGRIGSEGFAPKNIGFCGFVRCIHVHQSFWRKVSTTIYDPSDSDYYNFAYMPPFHDPNDFKKRTIYNCIAGSNSIMHKNNYFYKDQFSTDLSNYVIEDVNKFIKNEKTK
tara:strand:- start:16507 stop:17682 length:1176 start_codon:yes stop_codon:yes gene_type:complete